MEGISPSIYIYHMFKCYIPATGEDQPNDVSLGGATVEFDSKEVMLCCVFSSNIHCSLLINASNLVVKGHLGDNARSARGRVVLLSRCALTLKWA